MASSYTSELRIEKIATGEQSGSWGTTTNTQYDILESAISGTVTVAFASNGNDTLTTANGTDDEARHMFLHLSGGATLDATRNMVVPTKSKLYIVHNATTGSQAVQIIGASGNGTTVPNGQTMALRHDGTNVVPAFNHVAITGGTITGLTGDVTAGNFQPNGDTSAGDTAALGYTSVLGAILTGQGSTNDVTLVNDADGTVLGIPTGTTNVDIVGDVTAANFQPDGDTASGDTAAFGYTSVLGAIVTGQGSTNDVTLVNDADATVLGIPTGTTNVNFAGNVILSDASSVNISTPLLAGTDHTFTGLSAEMLAGGAIAAFDLVCVHTTTQEVVEADASAYATARVIGIAPAAISDTATGTVLLQGFVRDDTWAWTTGSTLYLSETAGAMTHTAPTTDGAFVNVVGVALSPDVVYINPSMDVIEHA